MQELVIRKFPDPVLRIKAAKVSGVTACEKEILSEMARIMYLARGVGLAASQVGIDKQLAVIDVGSGLIKLVNPVIVKRSGWTVLEEGCLSVTDVSIKVRRSKFVTVNFLDEEGCARQVRAGELLARAVQHELDHLSGILIVDHLNPVKKMFLKRKLKRAKERKEK